MRTFFLILICCISLCTTHQAAAQQTRVKFYYYPSANVYYNPTTKDYWFHEATTNAWATVKELPDSISIIRTPKHILYYTDNDVWKDNAAHLKKFKVKKNGEVKMKPKKNE